MDFTREMIFQYRSIRKAKIEFDLDIEIAFQSLHYYLQDFDSLRSGSITKSQFRRGLSDLGLSALGQHNLTEVQFQALCAYYTNPDMKDKVQWMRFMYDIESGE